MITLIDFYADWCGPCQAVKPFVKKIAQEMSDKLKVEEVNVDIENDKASDYGVMSIPTFVILKDGKEVDRRIGAMDEATLRNWVNSQVS